MSTKNSRRTNAPTGFAELAKRMNLTYQPAEKPSMQLIRPFPGAGRIVPSPPCVLSPTVPHRVRARISRTVGHARGIPDKNRRNQRVNLLIYTLLKPTFMKNFYCKCRLHLWLACLTAGIGLSACSDGDEGGGIRDTNPTNPSNSNRSILKPGR